MERPKKVVVVAASPISFTTNHTNGDTNTNTLGKKRSRGGGQGRDGALLLSSSSSSTKATTNTTTTTTTTTTTMTTTTIMKRTFYLWILIGSCLFMILFQFRQTKQVIRLSKRNDSIMSHSQFLLPQQKQQATTTTTTTTLRRKKKTTTTRNLDSAANRGHLKDTTIGEEEDDEFMDDDNVFNDDQQGDDEDQKAEEDFVADMPQQLDKSAAARDGNDDQKDDSDPMASLEMKLEALKRQQQEENGEITTGSQSFVNSFLKLFQRHHTRQQKNNSNRKETSQEVFMRARQRNRIENSSRNNLLSSVNNKEQKYVNAMEHQRKNNNYKETTIQNRRNYKLMRNNQYFNNNNNKKDDTTATASATGGGSSRYYRPKLDRIVLDWKPPNWNTTTDYSKQYPILTPHILPDMTTDRGGIIFFLHVPKTGGQTIRQFNLRFRKHVQRRDRKFNGIDILSANGLYGGRRHQHGVRRGGGVRRGDDVAAAAAAAEASHRFLLETSSSSSSSSSELLLDLNPGGSARQLLEKEEEEDENEDGDGDEEDEDKEQGDYVPEQSENGKRESILRMDDQTPTSTEQGELFELTREKLRFVAANTLRVFQEEVVPQVNNYLNLAKSGKKKEKILFVEVHGMDNYNALELEPFLHYWRDQAKKNDIPWFSFVLLREPISLQVSFFNYYYIHPADPRFCKNPLKPKVKCGAKKKANKRLERMERAKMRAKLMELREQIKQEENVPESVIKTLQELETNFRNNKGMNHANGIENVSHEELEKAMLQVAYHNPQCLFLARGERTFGDEAEARDLREMSPLSRKDCQQTYLSLQRTMDWIGRTDTLDSETLPLLTHIMFGKPHLGKQVPKVNVSPTKGGYVKRSNLQDSTRKALDRISQFDQELYHRAMQDYSLDQWANETAY